MLRRLVFTNFKTWEKVEIEFGQVTGLFGTNSSGKTSLIQFLLMLKQTKEATDRALSPKTRPISSQHSARKHGR
jgi:recombinational DNA repair ATPase RecF